MPVSWEWGQLFWPSELSRTGSFILMTDYSFGIHEQARGNYPCIYVSWHNIFMGRASCSVNLCQAYPREKRVFRYIMYQSILMEWSLIPRVLEENCRTYGKLMIDLFTILKKSQTFNIHPQVLIPWHGRKMHSSFQGSIETYNHFLHLLWSSCQQGDVIIWPHSDLSSSTVAILRIVFWISCPCWWMNS